MVSAMEQIGYVIYINPETKKPEFINSIFLKQKYFEEHPLDIIGVARKYEDALQFLADYVASSYDENGKYIFEE